MVMYVFQIYTECVHVAKCKSQRAQNMFMWLHVWVICMYLT